MRKLRESGCCEVCGKTLRAARYGRPRRYCGAACKQYAYRARTDGLQGVQNDVAYVQCGVTKWGAL